VRTKGSAYPKEGISGLTGGSKRGSDLGSDREVDSEGKTIESENGKPVVS